MALVSYWEDVQTLPPSICQGCNDQKVRNRESIRDTASWENSNPMAKVRWE